MRPAEHSNKPKVMLGAPSKSASTFLATSQGRQQSVAQHPSKIQVACKALHWPQRQQWMHAVPAEELLSSAPHLHPIGEVLHLRAALERAAGAEGVRDHGAPGLVLSGRHD